MSGRIRLLVCMSTTITATLLLSCSVAMAGTFPVVICGSSPRDPAHGLSWSSNAPLVAIAQCPYNGPGLELYTPANKTVGKNATAAFKVTAPGGIDVYSIHVGNAYSSGIGTGGWWGEFYWNGGPGPAGRTGPLNDVQFNNSGCCSQTNLRSGSIGSFIACNQASCSSGSAGRVRGMGELDLVAEEDRAPTIIASGRDNLWYQSGWVRGRWPVSFTASDPSGVCGAAVVFGSLPAIVTPTPDTAPSRHAWQQCPQLSVPAAVDTSASDGSLGRGEGRMDLRLTATNAAYVTANPTKAVYVDNSTPTVSLAGPVDAPSTAGTQYVTATAAGSPSGIADIVCTVDGGPAQPFAGARAQVPVSGIGTHTVGCFAEDNAVDPSGTHGRSTTASWSLKIGQPTEVGIAFDRLVGLRCHSARVRVTIPGHWITARRHGKPVRIKTRARSKLERVQRCHPRTVRRRTVVFVRARRHGHLVKLKRVEYVLVVVPPHVVAETARVVPFGHGTTVSGWLGSSSGTALAGQVVHVLTAPNNGSNAFAEAATVTTTATGSWTAQLGPGPSRVVEAVFDGSPTTESSSSGQVRVVVPAMVRIAIRPRIVPWGAEIRITGRVLGGYVPTNSNLLRLDVGIGRIGHIEGLPQILPDGRFLIVWKFDHGQGVVYPWFSVGTLSEAAFPYAPGTSKRVTVTLGEATPIAAATNHKSSRYRGSHIHRSARRERRSDDRSPPRRSAGPQPLASVHARGTRAHADRDRGRGPTQPAARGTPQRAAPPRSARRQAAHTARPDGDHHHCRGRGHRWPAALRAGTRRPAPAVHPWAVGVSVDSRDASGARRGLRPPVRAGALTRVQGRHGPQLHLVLHLGQEHLVPDPQRAPGRPTAAIEAQEVGAGRKWGYFTVL